MKYQEDFFDALEKNGVKVTDEQRRQINEKLNSILTYEPVVGIFGKTGVGKSSFCNALFGEGIFEINDIEACTRNPQEFILGFGSSKGIKLIDVPGAGESRERDKEYRKLYSRLLPKLDLVLWMIKADDRAFTSDETFYEDILKPHIDEGKCFFIVLNQVDKIEPFREWDLEKHEPSHNQLSNITLKISDVARFFRVAQSKVIPISSSESYNLTRMVDEIVFSLPKERVITFFKKVNKELRSDKANEHVKKSFLELVVGTVGEVVKDTGVAVVKIVETAGRVLEKAIDKIGGKIVDILDNIPFIGKRGCFITTAICLNSGKKDDCIELQTFRKFRDNWLSRQEGGNNLIEQYYEIAPKILSAIDKSENSNDIYRHIDKEYLQQCFAYILDNKFEECKIMYEKMVKDLMKEHLPGY